MPTWSYSRQGHMHRTGEMFWRGNAWPQKESGAEAGRARSTHIAFSAPCAAFLVRKDLKKLHFVQFPYKKEDRSTHLCNKCSQLTSQIMGWPDCQDCLPTCCFSHSACLSLQLGGQPRKFPLQVTAQGAIPFLLLCVVGLIHASSKMIHQK